MSVRSWLSLGALAIVLTLPGVARAQSKDLTVAYLRAAVGSLSDRSPVQFEGIFVPDPGLVETTGMHMRGKGYSRFSVKDLRSGTVFTSAYCRQDSQAFRDLLAAGGPKAFRFTGTKDYGELNEPAVHISTVEAIDEKPAKAAQEQKTARAFRVVIKDAANSRTELANVVLGQAYRVAGLTIVIEEEPSPAVDGVGKAGL